MQDESGSTSAITFMAPSTTTVAAVDTWASALASAAAAVSGCVLIRTRLRYRTALVTPGMAAIGSSIKHTGAFFFTTSMLTPSAIVLIPAIVDAAFFTSGFGAGYVIDPDNSDVVAFVDAIIASGCTNPFGDVVTAFESGYLQSRV